jgi:tetratricopeptide (TPR) repeat protein
VNEIKISDRYVEKRGEVLRYSPYLKPSVVQHLQIDAWAAMGELDRAEKLYSEALPVSGRRRPLTPLRMAKAYALRGHHDRAKELLDQAQSTATRFRSVRIERELNSVHMTLGANRKLS